MTGQHEILFKLQQPSTLSAKVLRLSEKPTTEDNARPNLRLPHGHHSSAIMTSTVPGPERPFPFEKLPTELRLLVYNFALQDFIEELEAAPRDSAILGEQLPDHGLPALLEIKSLRFESSDAMLLPTRAHLKRHQGFRTSYFKNVSPLRMNEEVVDAYRATLRRFDIVRWLKRKIERTIVEERRANGIESREEQRKADGGRKRKREAARSSRGRKRVVIVG